MPTPTWTVSLVPGSRSRLTNSLEGTRRANRELTSPSWAIQGKHKFTYIPDMSRIQISPMEDSFQDRKFLKAIAWCRKMFPPSGDPQFRKTLATASARMFRSCERGQYNVSSRSSLAVATPSLAPVITISDRYYLPLQRCDDSSPSNVQWLSRFV